MPLADVISAERFSTYLLWAGQVWAGQVWAGQVWAGQDVRLGERLYAYNVKLSSDFYCSLHMLEIALRNKTDLAMTAKYGSGWLENDEVLLDCYQHACVQDARKSLRCALKIGTHGQMISELNLGFWSSLFGKHSNHLWGQTLRPIFNFGGLQRSTVAERLRNLRRLRNRVAHFEPILAHPLAKLYKD